MLGHAAPALAELVIRDLLDAGRITGRDRLSVAGRGISLTAEESRVRDAIDRTLSAAFLQPPEMARLAEIAAAPAASVEKMLTLLVRQKIVVRLDGMPFHRDALDRLKDGHRQSQERGGRAGHHGRDVQRPLRPEPQARDSAVGVSGSGASHASGRRRSRALVRRMAMRPGVHRLVRKAMRLATACFRSNRRASRP